MQQLLFIAAFLLGQTSGHREGYLVIVGGGPTIPEIVEKALGLAGGRKARVVIIPQASTRPDTGQRSGEMWRKAGAASVTVLDFKDRKAALAAVKEADLIWMPGGSQTLLMQALAKNGMIGPIRDRYQHGATVGGTSAGAAVMSMIMLTGDAAADRITFSNTAKSAEGLGFMPEVIIDQHHIRRKRFNRLMSAVLNHPKLVGIGIDESTAVVVRGRSFEVVGKSNVIVIDARKMKAIPTKEGEPGAAANVALHLLKAGMKFDLEKGVMYTIPKERTDRLTHVQVDRSKTKP
jgi:cyanophycinase